MRIADRVEDRIGIVQRLAGKEHLRHQAREPHPAPHREVHVRRPPPARGIGHRVGGGLDGAQLDQPTIPRDKARGAVEVRIGRRIVGVVGMDVLAGGIAMPDFDHRSGDRRAVLVDHARAQVDQLAERALRAMAGKIAAHAAQAPRQVLRTGKLGVRLRPAHQRLRRPALKGLRVARHGAFGLCFGVAPRQHG